MKRHLSQFPSRRNVLRLGVAVGGLTGLSTCLSISEGVAPRGDPAERPSSQHRWDSVLATDDDGNRRPPQHHIFLGLTLKQQPSLTDQERLEAALLRLEEAYGYTPSGLVFAIGYSPSYFASATAIDPPIPQTLPLTELDAPSYDSVDAIVHLASDSATVVLEAEQSLFGQESPNGLDPIAIDDFFAPKERRTGFVGPGLPATYAENTSVSEAIPEDAPFLMGFRSGFRESQASEDRVTIQSGPFTGGTTLHIESSTFNLRQWYEQDTHTQRVAKLFSPDHADNGIGTIGETLGANPGTSQTAEKTHEHARTRGIIGHAQKAARGRDADGSPVLLRRDVNTLDGEQPGLHFASYQRSLDEFVRVREAMTGADVTGSGVGQRLNNGILQYLHVTSRGNYLIPPREKRAFPALST